MYTGLKWDNIGSEKPKSGTEIHNEALAGAVTIFEYCMFISYYWIRNAQSETENCIYVRTYVCVCVCVCMYVYIYIYIYTHTHTHTHIKIYIYVCMGGLVRT